MKMICLRSSIFLFLLIVLICPELAQSQSRNSAVTDALEKLDSRMNTNSYVLWHTGKNRVKKLRGRLSFPHGGAPEEAARIFLEDNRAVFQMDTKNSDIDLGHIKRSPDSFHLRFNQSYRSLPVFKGGMEVHLHDDGSVYLMHNYYVPDINISIDPAMSEEEAIKVAKSNFMDNYLYSKNMRGEVKSIGQDELMERKAPSAELGIQEHGGEPKLTYKVLLDYDIPAALILYKIDANTGSVLKSRNLIRNAQGIGSVFDPNPVNTLNKTDLTDQNDANYPELRGAYFKDAELNDLNVISGMYYLDGPYVTVKDSLEVPEYFNATNGQISSSSGRFVFNRSDKKFEHVMVYYHIDKNQRYIQSLGAMDTFNEAIRVDPHGLKGDVNAHYKPDDIGHGYIAFGDGGVDAAEDADVILHEYGHAIQDNLTMGKYLYGGEAGAMGEGFADYWAASNGYKLRNYNGFDPECIGEWHATYYNADNPPCLRRVDGTKHYPEDMVGQEHADGEIWSAVLWDIFKEISSQVGIEQAKIDTDYRVIFSHYFVPEEPTFFDGAMALLEADDVYGGDIYHDIIEDKLVQRGILLPLIDIPFVDNDLAACVITSGYDYAQEVTSLDCSSRDITDLSGIEKLTNLTWLNLDYNNISDIEPIKSLSNITDLYMSFNDLTDIGAISWLSNLKNLLLAANNISDISPLSVLSRIEWMNLISNNISDLQPLSSLTTLHSLYLADNNIGNLSPLASLYNLLDLSLGFNNISDVSPLASLTRLWGLNLESNSISNVRPLASLRALDNLDLDMNNVVDLWPLASLRNLTYLDLSRNWTFTNVRPLSYLTDLITLELTQNNILVGVASLVALQNAQRIALQGNANIPCVDLDALIAALGSGVVWGTCITPQEP